MPVSRVDVPSNSYQLDYPDHNPSSSSPTGNRRTPLRLLNQSKYFYFDSKSFFI